LSLFIFLTAVWPFLFLSFSSIHWIWRWPFSHARVVLLSPLTAENGDPAMSRRRPNFSTRTAQEDVSRLDPNEQSGPFPIDRGRFLHWPSNSWSRQEVNQESSGRRASPSNSLDGLSRWWRKKIHRERGQEDNDEGVAPHMPLSAGPLRDSSVDKKDRHLHRTRSTEESKKLGTFSGVFVPTTLNVLSILMFIRFGFILGQAGILGILGKFTSRV
jgi:potassium/chloride transporter 9